MPQPAPETPIAHVSTMDLVDELVSRGEAVVIAIRVVEESPTGQQPAVRFRYNGDFTAIIGMASLLAQQVTMLGMQRINGPQ